MISQYLPQFKSKVKQTTQVIHNAGNFLPTQLEFNFEAQETDVSYLGERQKLVYKTLKDYDGGATAKELSVYLFNEGKVASHERNSVHPRLNELIKEGLVKVTGKKTCQYTDRKVSIYKVIN